MIERRKDDSKTTAKMELCCFYLTLDLDNCQGDCNGYYNEIIKLTMTIAMYVMIIVMMMIMMNMRMMVMMTMMMIF